jgi:hypothetical protein
MGKRRTNTPNELGGILIGLSNYEKFPPSLPVEPKHKTAISKLRHSLCKLVNLSEDPFAPFNEGDGWRPRFELIDDRRNADERAKNEARFVQFDESRDGGSEAPDFERQIDENQLWIDREEYRSSTSNPPTETP